MSSSNQATVHLATRSGSQTIIAESGDSVLEALRRGSGATPPAPCAGRGRCGRCRIILESSGQLPAPEYQPEELNHLSQADRDRGIRLSCLLPAQNGMELRLEERGSARIETRAEGLDEELDPILKRISVVVPTGSLEDQRSTAARLEDLLDMAPGSFPAPLAAELPAIPDGETPISLIMEDNGPVAVDVGMEADAPVWAAAVDIGTTTVAMYLVDLSVGSVIGSTAEMNAQESFGADVISRLEHARKGVEEQQELQRIIVSQLQDLLMRLAVENGVHVRDLHLLAVAGNTAMVHLLAGWDPAGLGEAPFLPTALEAPAFAASGLGFIEFPRLRIMLLPSLSAYVGADITGGLVASAMKDRPGPDLLLDIGTNGEMALGGIDGLVCCSTAAGPAFEGAHLSCGVGSIPGAVDHVDWIDGRMTYTTIDEVAAAGFCGSGVVDLVAFLVRSGLMDETGRITETLDEKDAENYSGLEIVSGESGAELRWTDGAAEGRPLGFTQKDLREVQLAKAAIRAGVDTLMGQADIEADDIGTLWLAGGFGSYIRPESAAAIGLIPPGLASRTKSLGNAAARGALLCLLSRSRSDEARAIAREAKTIELSGRPDFQNSYIEAMMFPSGPDNG